MIRKRIKKEMISNEFSVYKLAKLTGMQITQLNAYLKGLKGLDSSNIEKLFEVLKIKV